ncbi:unknown [Clostridium sp. CAG:433]|nr:unknown [Clostridium sp. CAG:433]
MKDEVGQKKYCIVISIIGLILGIIGFIIEYFVMNKFDIIWIIFLVVNIFVLFINLTSKK